MYQLLNTRNVNQEFVSVTLQKVVRCSARSLTEGKFFCHRQFHEMSDCQMMFTVSAQSRLTVLPATFFHFL